MELKGFQIFDYVDEKTFDTVLMQQYFIAFLKAGPKRDQTEGKADSLQKLHLDHLGRMKELGYADISGPFGVEGELYGITIYNVPTLQMADSLAHMDPMVSAGILTIDMYPWWAAKSFCPMYLCSQDTLFLNNGNIDKVLFVHGIFLKDIAPFV
ncbi:MAG: hypothetical protein ACJAZR_002679 [Sediminicola sp.]